MYFQSGDSLVLIYPSIGYLSSNHRMTEAISMRTKNKIPRKQTPEAIRNNPVKKARTASRKQNCSGFSIAVSYIATLTTIFLIGAGPSTANPGRWASCGVNTAN